MARNAKRITIFLWIGLLTTAGLMSGDPLSASAQAPPDEEVERRLAFIGDRLDARRLHTEIWQGAWTGINGGTAVILGISASRINSRDDRIAFGTQSVLALIGLGDQYLIRPIPGLNGVGSIRRLPDTTPEQKKEKLAKAEAILWASANREAERTDWPYHLGNAALNSAAGAVIGIFGKTKDGIIAGASGFLGGIVYAFSEPWGRQQDWRDYQRFRKGLPYAQSSGWSVTANAGMLSLHYQF